MYATSDRVETWLIPSGTTGLDSSTSQLWYDATCTCNTDSSTLSCLFQQKERDKAEVSTARGTGARCVKPWLTRAIVYLCSGEDEEGVRERGVAGTDPSTRGRSPVVLEVRFRSRAFSIAEIQSEIVLGYLHYLDFCTV